MTRLTASTLLAVAAVLTTCGGSSTPQPVSYAYRPSQARIPACAHAGKPIPLPAGFPKQFPFPRGTDIDATKPLLLKRQIGIYGFVPSTSFASTVNFFRSQVPKQGFKLIGFEVDAPNDSEGTYQGHGVVGRWQLRKIFGCPRAMTFAASAVPSK